MLLCADYLDLETREIRVPKRREGQKEMFVERRRGYRNKKGVWKENPVWREDPGSQAMSMTEEGWTSGRCVEVNAG